MRLTLVGLAAVGLVAGCKPTISYFRASPNVICSGTSAVLSWSASADSVVHEKRTGAAVGSAERDGKATVTPSQPTTYRVDASSTFGTTSREIDVDVISANPSPPPLGASIADPRATCANGRLTIPVDAGAEYWDAHVFAASVVGLGDRALRVEHLGATAELDAGGSSAAFAAIPVQGKWILSTPLQNGESCGPDLPRNLAVQIVPKCSP
jgi:hypothetical protein